MSNSNKKGFTLIELLVVISIIALLSSIVLASLADARNKAKATKIVQEVRQFQTAMEAYRTANGSYPVSSATWFNSNGTTKDSFEVTLSPYIKVSDLTFTKQYYSLNFIRAYIEIGGVPSANCGGGYRLKTVMI